MNKEVHPKSAAVPSVVFAVLAFAITITGCSTVQPRDNGRRGLLDRLGEIEIKPAHKSENLSRSGSRTISSERMLAARQAAANWQWPLQNVAVTSVFGRRGGAWHEGLDLRARPGTPVHAVENGRVFYAGTGMSGYGRLVIVNHSGGLRTFYAHNSKILVRKGEKVKKGQKIALSGKSGRTRGPHLHFEVRDGDMPIDPVLLLPPMDAKLASSGKKPTSDRAREVAFQAKK